MTQEETTKQSTLFCATTGRKSDDDGTSGTSWNALTRLEGKNEHEHAQTPEQWQHQGEYRENESRYERATDTT